MESLVLRAIKKYVYAVDEAKFCSRMNRFGAYLGYLPKIKWDSGENLYHVCDDDVCVFASRKSRLRLYSSGVRARLEFLTREYLADEVQINDGDIIIDVGANVGEFSKSLSLRHNVRVVAIEPEELEVASLSKNLSQVASEVFNILLWSSNQELNFYSANESGDSSVFKPRHDALLTTKSAITLDSIVDRSQILSGNFPIKLLKLEAEGAEPEIIAGSTKILERIEYIAADVGPERGVSKESTLIPVLEALSRSGFVPVKFGLPRATILFKKTKVSGF